MPDFSSLPSVTALASIPELEKYSEAMRIRAAREAVEYARKALARGNVLDPVTVVIEIARRLRTGSVQRVRNMSGVILHTGLGRAPAMESWDEGYCNLEFDLDTGKRGDRQEHVGPLLCELTGAEDALVVNNGAAGVLLALSALCYRKEVLLSRGQSIEIGGAFRMPDVIKASGCKLVDVGATNKTYLADYEKVLTPSTGAILRCHPSNYQVSGFVHEPKPKQLAKLAHDHGTIFINDQGNGSLVDFSKYGLHDIETLQQSVASNADVTIGSGDKLLGGPQCGIILGRKDLVTRMKKNPLARALRIDKTNLMFLQSVLTSHLLGEQNRVPLFRMLNYPEAMIKEWCEAISPDGAEILESVTEIGSGAAPGQGVKSYSVVLTTKKPDNLLAELRQKRIIGRIHKGKVWLDPRTVDESIVYINSDIGKVKIGEHSNGLKKQIVDCWEKWK